MTTLASRMILGTRVDATTYEDAAERVTAWAREGSSRVVCVTNVHGVMEAVDDPAFASTLNAADLVTPDGVPLVWGLRALGVASATRVYGPDLTPALCAAAAAAGIPVGFYGASPRVLDALIAEVRRRYPDLEIAYRESPPFRALTRDEDDAVVAAMEASGARIMFIGLGCPKQERWMIEHRGRVPCVMVGVGAAFDFLAGAKRQAPRWMMRAGLEWCFRLATEPRRLWRRYLKHNPRFVVRFLAQMGAEGLRRGGRYSAGERMTKPKVATSRIERG